MIEDDQMAFSSGYKGTRAIRTWSERILQLRELGFIDVKARGNNDIGYILIWNPLTVCARLRASGIANDEWWNEFLGRAAEIGAVIPMVKPLPKSPKKP